MPSKLINKNINKCTQLEVAYELHKGTKEPVVVQDNLFRCYALHLMCGVPLNVEYRTAPGIPTPSGREVGMPWFI